MNDSDPYKHIRALARSMVRPEESLGPVEEAAEKPPATAPAPSATASSPPSPTPRDERGASDLAAMAALLKRARRRRGLTQQALGRRVGVPQSHISKIEAGGVDVRLSSLLALAAALDLRLALVPANTADRLTEPVATVREPPDERPDAAHHASERPAAAE